MRSLGIGLCNTLIFSAALTLAGGSVPATSAQQSPGPVAARDGSDTHAAPVRYHPERFPKKAGEYYALVWGIDLLGVKATESGAVIRFSYRVLDPHRAKTLNQKTNQAFLNVPARHIQLVVPSLEKVGQLRQTGDPESGKSYWMAFSNPHRVVKPGDHVDVVIGNFRAAGLVVQ